MSDGTHTAAYVFVANWPLAGKVDFTNHSSFQMTATKGYDLLNRLLHIVSTADGGNLVTTTANTNTAGQSQTWGLDLSDRLQGAGAVGGLAMLNDSVQGVQFCAYDGNGKVAALIKAPDATTTSHCEYDPFGELIRATSANPLVRQSLGGGGFRFSTKYQDDEADLLYYGYRYYNASAGRWLSRDPIGEKGGENLYSVCRNNPVTSFDILGREPQEVARKWGPIKKDDPGACQYGNKIKFSADFLIDEKCQPAVIIGWWKQEFKPCAVKRFAWPVDCVCKNMSDSDEDQCVRGCLKYKYDTTRSFPTVNEHLDCVRQCTGSAIGVLDFVLRLGPVLTGCAKESNCYVGKATGMPEQYKGECQDKKDCAPCCGQRRLR